MRKYGKNEGEMEIITGDWKKSGVKEGKQEGNEVGMERGRADKEKGIRRRRWMLEEGEEYKEKHNWERRKQGENEG